MWSSASVQSNSYSILKAVRRFEDDKLSWSLVRPVTIKFHSIYFHVFYQSRSCRLMLALYLFTHSTYILWYDDNYESELVDIVSLPHSGISTKNMLSHMDDWSSSDPIIHSKHSHFESHCDRFVSSIREQSANSQPNGRNTDIRQPHFPSS